MYRYRVVLSAALLLVSCSKEKANAGPTANPDSATATAAAVATTKVHGQVLGFDGKPLKLGHVRVLGTAAEKVPEVQVGEDGKFELDVPHAGLAQLEVTGVDHAPAKLPVVLDGQPLEVTVKLGTHPREDPLPAPSLLTWAADPESSPPTQSKFDKQDDGTWVAELDTDAERIWYQIAGLTGPGRTANGPQSDAYQYDGGGDYRSVLAPAGGKVRIVVDPAQLITPDQPVETTLGDPNGPSARYAAIKKLADDEQEKIRKLMEEAKPSSPQEADAVIDAHDFSGVRKQILDALDAEEHPVVRRGILGAYFSLGNYDAKKATPADRARAKELLGEMPASDPGWDLFSGAMVTAATLSDDPRHAERMDVLLAQELEPMKASEILFGRMIECSLGGDDEGARDAYKKLQSDRFAKTPFYYIAKQYDPDRAIRAGAKFPAFELDAIGGKKKTPKKVTNEDLTGKVYLIDVWATWCKPCVAEMGDLHAAYDKYATKRKTKKGDREFEILSVSVDKGTEEVATFRKERFPMPWRHAHLSFDEAGSLFGIAGIPYAVLLDEEGTILATSPQVSGSSLAGVLEKVLAEPKPGAK